MANIWKKLKKPFFVLAPMDGFTDSPFRQMCRQYGADLVYSEFVHVDMIFHRFERAKKILEFKTKEKPLIIQLVGTNLEKFIHAVKILNDLKINGVDINCGCPANQVTKQDGGVKLMTTPERTRILIKNVLNYSRHPVSVKIRAGIKSDGKFFSALDFLDNINDLPINAVIVHGRTADQGHSGPVDFEIIKKARQHTKALIIGNGGIYTPEDAKTMLEKSGCDGIALGQGTIGKPYLFKQCQNFINTGSYTNPSVLEIKKIILKHAQLAYKFKNETGLLELRKHLVKYIKGFPNASSFRQEILTAQGLLAIKKVLKKIPE